MHRVRRVQRRRKAPRQRPSSIDAQSFLLLRFSTCFSASFLANWDPGWGSAPSESAAGADVETAAVVGGEPRARVFHALRPMLCLYAGRFVLAKRRPAV